MRASRLRCKKCGRIDGLRVVQRLCNFSAFSGYRRTPSRYSAIRCMCCNHYWRTLADVNHLPDEARA